MAAAVKEVRRRLFTVLILTSLLLCKLLSSTLSPFSPILKPLLAPPVHKKVQILKLPLSDTKFTSPVKKHNPTAQDKFQIEDSVSGGALSLLRSMVAVCLLQKVPFEPIESSTILRKLENDQSITAAERAASTDVGGESCSLLEDSGFGGVCCKRQAWCFDRAFERAARQ